MAGYVREAQTAHRIILSQAQKCQGSNLETLLCPQLNIDPKCLLWKKTNKLKRQTSEIYFQRVKRSMLFCYANQHLSSSRGRQVGLGIRPRNDLQLFAKPIYYYKNKVRDTVLYQLEIVTLEQFRSRIGSVRGLQLAIKLMKYLRLISNTRLLSLNLKILSKCMFKDF